eukprot:TRINITY_DN629_c0_g1_i2.p1 TRINITY_DN629_c0_g1~~TRINITY_DN629_c0_g1_i2.p1  ORF type:complete len:462 (-),score=133.25 TRINITY_DN629_c0_g1_i2:77-1462(-)
MAQVDSSSGPTTQSVAEEFVTLFNTTAPVMSEEESHGDNGREDGPPHAEPAPAPEISDQDSTTNLDSFMERGGTHDASEHAASSALAQLSSSMTVSVTIKDHNAARLLSDMHAMYKHLAATTLSHFAKTVLKHAESQNHAEALAVVRNSIQASEADILQPLVQPHPAFLASLGAYHDAVLAQIAGLEASGTPTTNSEHAHKEESLKQWEIVLKKQEEELKGRQEEVQHWRREIKEERIEMLKKEEEYQEQIKALKAQKQPHPHPPNTEKPLPKIPTEQTSSTTTTDKPLPKPPTEAGASPSDAEATSFSTDASSPSPAPSSPTPIKKGGKSSEAISSPKPDKDPRDIIKQGWMVKQGHVVKNWKRRYFKLIKDTSEKGSGSGLAYYKREGGDYTKPAGLVKLRGAEVKLYDSPRGETIVMVTPSALVDPKQKIFLLKSDVEANAAELMKEWLAALSEASKL